MTEDSMIDDNLDALVDGISDVLEENKRASRRAIYATTGTGIILTAGMLLSNYFGHLENRDMREKQESVQEQLDELRENAIIIEKPCFTPVSESVYNVQEC